MNPTLYNILWADDECGAYKDNDIVKAVLRKKRIKVHFSQNSTELRNDYNKYKDLVDAVIIDGNFSKRSVGKVDKDDMSGFVDSLALLELCNVRRTIPFFLFTSRKVSLESIFKNGELDYFSETRLIQKGSDFDVLFDNIIAEIEKINSDEYQVRKRNAALLEMAKEISEDCSANLYDFLLAEAKDRSFDNGINIFNSLRLIMEDIVTSCRKKSIIPEEIEELNDFKEYFANKNGWARDWCENIYKPKRECEVMPLVISKTLWNLVDILQDGSHKKEVLTLHVSEYVSEVSKSPFLFRSCLYQVMELVQWHHRTLERMDNIGNGEEKMSYESWESDRNPNYKPNAKKYKEKQ